MPGKFPDKWLTIKSNTIKAIGLERQLPNTLNELLELKGHLLEFTKEAIDEIYKEMKLKSIKIEKVLIKKKPK